MELPMNNLKTLVAATALACGALVGAPAAIATPLPIGGPWVVLDQMMSVGDFFTAPDGGTVWTLNCPASGCNFVITDFAVVTDQFKVFDGGVLIATTPLMPDWFGIGATDPFESPPFTLDPDIAFASGNFSSLVIALGAGAHSLEISDIHIPPHCRRWSSVPGRNRRIQGDDCDDSRTRYGYAAGACARRPRLRSAQDALVLRDRRSRRSSDPRSRSAAGVFVGCGQFVV